MRNVILLLLCAFTSISVCSAFGDSPGFTNAIGISKQGDNSTIPQLIVSGNNVYVGWIDNNANSFKVFFTKSTDGGSTFETPFNLGNSSQQGADNLNMMESNGKLYAIWQSTTSSGSVIYFSKSADEGNTFSSPSKVSLVGTDSAFPKIAVSGDHVYAVWLERIEQNVTNVAFAKSDDGGDSFGSPIAITTHSGTSGLPQISADANNVYLLWEDNSLGNFDVFFAKSTDMGNTFNPVKNISSNTGQSGTPKMVSAGNNIAISWMDDSSGSYNIMFSKSTDGGLTFSKPLNISNSTKDAGYPELALSGNNVYVTWTNTMEKNNYDILFSKSDDGGQTFANPVNISNNSGASGWPQIAVSRDVYISWVDNTPGNFDIYIAKSIDNGASFETPVNISNTPNESWYNRMAVHPDTVYMVWQEANGSNHDIMFTKSTTFVPEFGPVVSIVLVIGIMVIVAASRIFPMKFSS